MKVSAVILLALVAIAFVATSEAAAPTAFCRVSSYKVPLALAIKNKSSMYEACLKAKKITERPLITKQETKSGCVLLTQKVSSAAAWDAYSACEKSADNTALYTPLNSQAAACKAYQSKGPC